MPDNYFDARHLRIIRPQRARKGQKFDQWITATSLPWQRAHITQVRRYLALEFETYGMGMDESDECWRDIEVYTFCETVLLNERSSDERDAVVGAACFQRDSDHWTLMFIWLHPFWRNRGMCQRAWPAFVERYGSFKVEPPISKQMQGLLKSISQSAPEVV